MENMENTNEVNMDCIWWAEGQEACGCGRCTEALQPARAAGLIPPFGADEDGWWEDAESRASYAESLPPRRKRRKQTAKQRLGRLDGRQYSRSRKGAENARKFEEAIAPRMKAIQEDRVRDPDPVCISGLIVIRNSTRNVYIFSRTLDSEWQCYPDWV